MEGHRLRSKRMAREVSLSIGREVTLARSNLALSLRAAAKLAGVASHTQRRVEAGDATVGIATLCATASAVGLKVWAKAYPVQEPSLRDTGQLVIAGLLQGLAHSSWRCAVEHRLRSGHAIDVVLFGPDEIIAVEIERLLADFQAQYRAADGKRSTLADEHRRPVRLVIVVEDTRRNRTAIAEHASLVRSVLPAGSREVLRALRSGASLGRDGILWVRRRP